MERITVGGLAKELGVKPNDVMRLADEVGMRLTRVAATMTPKQADRVRARLADRRKAEEQRITRGLRPAPAPAPALLVHAASKPEAQVAGLPNACTCCGVAVRRGPYAATGVIGRCRDCDHHYPIAGEDDSRVLQRLREHEARLLEAYRREAEAAAEYGERMKAALRSRNSWRGALVETALAHEGVAAGGACRCGAKEFPCYTLRQLEAANKGIALQVERFGTMKDDDREAELYPRGHWDHEEDIENPDT